MRLREPSHTDYPHDSKIFIQLVNAWFVSTLNIICLSAFLLAFSFVDADTRKCFDHLNEIFERRHPQCRQSITKNIGVPAIPHWIPSSASRSSPDLTTYGYSSACPFAETTDSHPMSETVPGSLATTPSPPRMMISG